MGSSLDISTARPQGRHSIAQKDGTGLSSYDFVAETRQNILSQMRNSILAAKMAAKMTAKR